MMARSIHRRRPPRGFVARTGLPVPEVAALVADLRPRYAAAATARRSHPTKARPVRRRAIGAGHPCALDVRDQVLLVVVWLRPDPPDAVLASLFGVSDAAVTRRRARVLPVLAAAGLEPRAVARARLAPLAPAQRERPRQSRRGLDDVVRDGPDRVVGFDTCAQRGPRPPGTDATGKRHADGASSGKQQPHTLKTQVGVVGGAPPPGEGLDVPDSVPGPPHDLKLLARSGALAPVPAGVGAPGDLGDVGMDKLAPAGRPTAPPAQAPPATPLPRRCHLPHRLGPRTGGRGA